MGNYNSLVLTAADYNVVLSVKTSNGTNRYLLKTTSELNYDVATEGEYSYAIGNTEPIANKTNAKSYKGSWSIQTGELNAICQLNGFQTGVDIQDATLSIAAVVGDFALVFKNLNVLTDSGSIAAKSKETINKLGWQSLGLA